MTSLLKAPLPVEHHYHRDFNYLIHLLLINYSFKTNME